MKRISLSELLFLLAGLVLQVVAYCLTGDALLSFLCGMSGVCSVVLCSQRKISSFLFGFFQVTTYMILALRQRLYAEVAENAFYFITMVVGFFIWLKNYNREDSKVETRTLSGRLWALTSSLFVVGTALTYWILTKTNDSQPFMDALSSVPAFIAQILMITRFKEQWIFWLVVDVTTLILWINVKDWCMVAQFAFWIVTCIYGYFKWSE